MKTNHSASGHQLVSCTQKKGFALYIHIYLKIHMYILTKTQVQVGHTLKVSSTAWFVEYRNHQEHAMTPKKYHVFSQSFSKFFIIGKTFLKNILGITIKL